MSKTTTSKVLGGHPRFYKILEEMAELHHRKNNNYAVDGDPLSNLRSCEQFGLSSETGVMVRMGDKWSRLCELMKGKKDLVGESIKDTLLDMAVYSILEIIILEEKASKSPSIKA